MREITPSPGNRNGLIELRAKPSCSILASRISEARSSATASTFESFSDTESSDTYRNRRNFRLLPPRLHFPVTSSSDRGSARSCCTSRAPHATRFHTGCNAGSAAPVVPICTMLETGIEPHTGQNWRASPYSARALPRSGSPFAPSRATAQPR